MGLFIGSDSGYSGPGIEATCNGLSNIYKVVLGLLLFKKGLFTKVISTSISIITSTLGGLSSTNDSIIAFLKFGLTDHPTSERRPFNRNHCRCITNLKVSIMVLLVNIRLVGDSVRGVVAPRSGATFSALSLTVVVTSVFMGL